MKELHQERISLEKFLKSLGHMCMTNDQRIQHIIYDLTFDKPKDSSKIADAFLDESSIIENVSQNNLIGEELRAKRKNNLAIFHRNSVIFGYFTPKGPIFWLFLDNRKPPVISLGFGSVIFVS